MTSIRLTQYVLDPRGGGKIAPDVLDAIIRAAGPGTVDSRLIVGNQGREGAAVFDLGNGQGLISTADFFAPIVDDPFDFGRISATHAIGNVFAMGGTPVLALSILGWPLQSLPETVAGEVLSGAQAVCRELGLSLAGGHSIVASEPLFGLSVNGLVPLVQLKRNAGARPGDKLYLTKPLGVGILIEAQAQGLLAIEHWALARDVMLRPNEIGIALAAIEGVHAMTDVTGFGFAGHLGEMCRASAVAARVDFERLPMLREAEAYRRQGAVPDACVRNRRAIGEQLADMDEAHWQWLCDPQISGGLLVAVDPAWEDDVERLGREHGLELISFGECLAPTGGALIDLHG